MLVRFNLILTAVVLVSGYECLISQELPGIPALENDSYVVRLVQMQRSGPDYGEYKFTFVARNKKTGHEVNLALSNQTNSLKSAEIVKQFLVVFGEIRNAADVVTIFDLNQGEIRDSFICYGPQFSPTKRFIVYRKFSPRAAEGPATSDLLLVYDLGLSPQANRPTVTAGRAPAEEDVGLPVFPEENARSHSLDVWIEPPAQRHTIYPPAEYFWQDQDKKITLVDKQGDDNFLVTVDLARGSDQVTIKRRKIDIAELLEIDKTSPNYEGQMKQYSRSFMVRGISAGSGKDVILHIASIGPYKKKEMVVALP